MTKKLKRYVLRSPGEFQFPLFKPLDIGIKKTAFGIEPLNVTNLDVKVVGPVTFADLKALYEANPVTFIDFENSFGGVPVDENDFIPTGDGGIDFVNRDRLAGQVTTAEESAALSEHLSKQAREIVRNALKNELLGAVEAVSATSSRAEPPPIAEFLVSAFVPQKRRDAILGDFDERFTKDCIKFGAERARRRYWGNVTNSILPLAFRALRQMRAIALFEVARRYFFG